MSKQQTCEQRIDEELQSTLKTLRLLWESYNKGEDYCKEAEGYWPEYYLEFYYDNTEGCYRCLLSTGGPQDEFRFFPSQYDAWRVEYWFLDWWDGAHRTLTGENRNLLIEILQNFDDMGMLEAHTI